jgi:ribosomal protein L37E
MTESIDVSERCARCGHENAEIARFCAHCGVVMGEATVRSLTRISR